jgi:hypothetical protein
MIKGTVQGSQGRIISHEFMGNGNFTQGSDCMSTDGGILTV